MKMKMKMKMNTNNSQDISKQQGTISNEQSNNIQRNTNQRVNAID